MALRSTQPLTEMSTRSISWGKGGRCIRLTTYHHPVPLSRNLGTLTSWKPLGLSRPVMGLLYLYLVHKSQLLVPNLNMKYPAQVLPSYYVNIHFNIIIPSTLPHLFQLCQSKHYFRPCMPHSLSSVPWFDQYLAKSTNSFYFNQLLKQLILSGIITFLDVTFVREPTVLNCRFSYKSCMQFL